MYNTLMKKIILPGLVAGATLLVLSILGIYATIWLFPTLAVLYFDPAFDTQSERAILYFAHPFIAGLALSWFWERCKGLFKGSFLRRGIEFGLLYWLVAVLPMMWLIYSAIAVPLLLVSSWVVFGLIQATAAGLVLGKMNAAGQ
jgi:hypothetical protein